MIDRDGLVEGGFFGFFKYLIVCVFLIFLLVVEVGVYLLEI